MFTPIKVKESLIEYYSTFQNSDKGERYSHILNLTLTDLDSTLDEITVTHNEASNLIDHIHKSQNKRSKDHSYLLVGYLIFLYGTADDEDVEQMKQDIQRLYDNQVD